MGRGKNTTAIQRHPANRSAFQTRPLVTTGTQRAARNVQRLALTNESLQLRTRAPVQHKWVEPGVQNARLVDRSSKLSR